jgi:hypothetical protein
MKVKCLKQYPTHEELEYLGENFQRRQEFHITAGNEYLVLGMSFLGNATWVDIECDSEHVTSVPLLLFEIKDPKVSRYWICKMKGNNVVVLWPPSWLQDFYHDDLLEGRESVVQDFLSVKELLEKEHQERNEKL